MHVKEILEKSIERERINLLIARQTLEILRAAMNDPQLTEPGCEYWEERCRAAKNEAKVLMSPDRDQLIIIINATFGHITGARWQWACSERARINEMIYNGGDTQSLRDRLKHFSIGNW